MQILHHFPIYRSNNKDTKFSFLKSLTSILIFIAVLLTGSCKKFIEIAPPTTELVSTTVFNNDASATAVILGIYSRTMNNEYDLSSGGLTLYAGLSADELKDYSTIPEQREFYANNLESHNYIVGFLWANPYIYIYSANSVIEGLTSTNGVSPAVKNQLMGEALFIRAFYDFYLVNLYGEIPIVISTDYKTNSLISRSPAKDVYQQILTDLTNSLTLLSDNFLDANNSPTNERARPTKSAAKALLARVYLYLGDYVDAQSQATTIINNPTFSLVNDLNSVFLMNSPEAILQFKPVSPSTNTNEGNFFILDGIPSGNGTGTTTITDQLMASFETGDMRKTDWTADTTVGGVTYPYPYKYKVKTSTVLSEYYTVLRLAEQYLIRAEARANQGDISGAQSDLNVIRARAGLTATTAADKASLLTAILHERQIELFAEWGHRWLDLKRTGQANNVLSSQKPNWNATDTLYPIPLPQIQNDPNTTQNAGY